MRCHHHPAADERADGVGPVVAERSRDLVADDVAQHSTEHRGDDAQDHGDDGRHAGIDRGLRADGGEQAQPQCVGPLHGAFGRLEMACTHEQHGADAQREQRPDPAGVLHPEQRAVVEQDVAHGAAPEGGQPGDHADPDRRLRAPSITPDRANATVATASTAVCVWDRAQGTVLAMSLLLP